MPRVTFTLPNGAIREVEGEAGLTVMHAALEARIPGIDADCYGDCACATCHVYVDAGWAAALPPPSTEERSMLSDAAGRRAESRLACQITLSAATDGIAVRVPQTT
ncbi:MAG: 2Fe-2S iron-sulfur cluster binding domain-containing protein [Rubritepida sp.]|nr:2Fe-2S iron-sulfur cluster binding domain-containing protein [Rubritepida sp.]